MAGKIEQAELALTESVTQTEKSLAALNDVAEGGERDGGLPEGWIKTTLGHFTEYGKTKKVERKDVLDDLWLLELEDVEKNSSKILKRLSVSERAFKSTKNQFEKGAVLYGKLRPYLNKIVLAPEDGVCTTEIIPINVEPFGCNKYIFYWLKSAEFLGYVNKVSYGVNMPRLGTKDGLAAPLVLPPPSRTNDIAQTLDTLLAQVDNIKNRLDAIPNILKTFRQSILAAAVSGKLTEEWRGENECERSFKTLGDAGVNVKTGPFGSALHKADYIEGGVPVINPMHINDGLISPSSGMTVKDEKYEDLKAWHLKWGDVIVGRRGEMGRAAVFKSDDKMLCGTGSMVLRGDDNVSSEYLCIILRSPTAIAYFVQGSVGSTMVNLNQKIIKALDVYFPPIKEQTEIVRRVEELFAFADQIEQQVKNAQGRVNNLTQSILAKAFRGELTADWRADNPDLISGENSAEALLAKIQEEREALKQKAKPKKKSTRKKSVNK